jgi:hypothetical protein
MKKHLLIGILALLAAPIAQAQLTEAEKVKKALSVENKDTVAWIHNGSINIGLNQGFLHNWSAGGEVVSLAVDGIATGNITRLYHRQVWSNTLDVAYSLFYAYSNGFVPRKVDDRIDFTSKYGVRLDTTKNFYLTGLFNFKTQATSGYDYSIPDWQKTSTSNFLSPAYMTLALGLEYREGSHLSLFFSPIAARITLADTKYTTRLPEGAFGVPYGKRSREELGAYFTGRYAHDVAKHVNFRTRLDLYANYLAKDRKDSLGNVVKRDNPGNIDILWDNIVTVKLGKYFDLAFALTAIYDNDIPYNTEYKDATGVIKTKDEPGTGLGWWQVKQIMTFAFAYKF